MSMEEPLVYLKKRADDDWLTGHNSHDFQSLVQELYLQLTQLSSREIPPKIFLAESNPLRFLAGFVAACAAKCSVFLCNPNWGESEWQQVFNIVHPDIIYGQIANLPFPVCPSPPLTNFSTGTIMIPTGGSCGKIRFAMHTWETLIASVKGFQDYFQVLAINSFCVLPLYHVSGLMQFMRSFTSGGKLAILPFKALESGNIYEIKPEEFFISLVPTQLQRLLENLETTSWLSRFETVFLGGAPACLELLEQARKNNIRIALTYGMTETASQVVTLKPDDFLQGNNSCGQVLPHAKITIQNSTNNILECNQIGNILITANSLALGYYPTIFNHHQSFQTDDLGFFDECGYLNLVGRSSNKIITGGENVFPSEVEAAILSTKLVTDVCVIGLPDNYWGEIVTAIYVPTNPEISRHEILLAIQDKLTKFKQPKHWLSVESLPRNNQGKINQVQIQELAKNLLLAKSSEDFCTQTHQKLVKN